MALQPFKRHNKTLPALLLVSVISLSLHAYGGGNGMLPKMEGKGSQKMQKKSRMPQTQVFKDHELVVFERLDLSDEQREKFQTIFAMYYKQRTQLLQQERQLLIDVFDTKGFNFDYYQMQSKRIGLELIGNRTLTLLNLYSFLEPEQQDEYRLKLHKLVAPEKRE